MTADRKDTLSRRQRLTYKKNIKALAELEYAGKLVSPKGTQAALVDDRYVVHLLDNHYKDLETGKVGKFKPGNLDFIS